MLCLIGPPRIAFEAILLMVAIQTGGVQENLKNNIDS